MYIDIDAIDLTLVRTYTDICRRRVYPFVVKPLKYFLFVRLLFAHTNDSININSSLQEITLKLF